MKYSELKVTDRLQITLKSPLFTEAQCNIVSIENKNERKRMEQFMLQEIKNIYGDLKGDWRSWNVCGCCDNSHVCLNPQHWFAFNAKNRKEVIELREVYDSGLIKTLPSGQLRVYNQLKNGNFNFKTCYKECPLCGEEINIAHYARHIKECDALREIEIHNHALKILKKERIEGTRLLVKKMIDKDFNRIYLDKNHPNKKKLSKKYAESFKKEYYEIIDKLFSDIKKDSILKEEYDCLKENNKNLTKRIKSMSEVFNKAQKVFMSADLKEEFNS